MSEPDELTVQSPDATTLVLGIVSIAVAIPFPLAAIVVGALGLRSAGRSGSPAAVLSRIGLIAGILLTVVTIVLVILAVVLGLDAFTVLYRQCEQLGAESGQWGPFPYDCN